MKFVIFGSGSTGQNIAGYLSLRGHKLICIMELQKKLLQLQNLEILKFLV